MTKVSTPPVQSNRYLPVCLLILVMGFAVLVLRQKEAMGGFGFLADKAYLDLAVARTMLQDGSYGVMRGHDIPMIGDVSWRAALAGASWLLGNYKLASYGLGAVCALLAMLLTLRLARGLVPSAGFILAAGLMVLVSPPLFLDGLSGTSSIMATFLATGACVLHVKGLGAAEERPLPLSAAFLTGLAAAVRIEFALLWLVFAIHAIIMSFFFYRQESGFAYTLLKASSGLVVIAICLAPALGWNWAFIGVPWPRMPGAPMALDMLAHGPPLQMIAHAAGPCMSRLYGMLFSTPLLQGLWARSAMVLGTIFLVWSAIRHRDGRHYAVLPLAVAALPAALGLVVPFLGWEGSEFVLRAMSPVWAIVVVFGLRKVSFLLESLLEKTGLAEKLRLRSGFIFGVLMLSLLISAAARNRVLVRQDLMARTQCAQERNKASRIFRSGALKDGVAVTDRPGWLVFVYKMKLIDLTGEISPRVLMRLGADGNLDYKQVVEMLRNDRASTLILWGDTFADLRNRVMCIEPFPAEFQKDLPHPFICQFKWASGS
ncbi:MAG: hypothetical protein V1929_03710 [bacterium]